MRDRIYWACWIGGTSAIVLSRFEFVSADVGWAGFYVACAAALLSRLPRRNAPEQSADFAILTRGMLESKDRGYELAMEALHRGGTVLHDGLAFAGRPENELGMAVVASLPADELDDRQVLQEAERAQAAFVAISRLSPEVAAFASDRRQRVSLLSEYGPRGVEICRVTDGLVEWKVKR